MKLINIDVGNNTLQVERGTSVQRLIELMESNSWNPADWVLTYVFPESDLRTELQVHNNSQLSEVSGIMAEMGKEFLSENNNQ